MLSERRGLDENFFRRYFRLIAVTGFFHQSRAWSGSLVSKHPSGNQCLLLMGPQERAKREREPVSYTGIYYCQQPPASQGLSFNLKFFFIFRKTFFKISCSDNRVVFHF